MRAQLAEERDAVRHLTAALREATEAPSFDPEGPAPVAAGRDDRNKPLTNQDLIRLWREPFDRKDEDSWFVEFARAVERAHGIGA